MFSAQLKSYNKPLKHTALCSKGGHVCIFIGLLLATKCLHATKSSPASILYNKKKNQSPGNIWLGVEFMKYSRLDLYIHSPSCMLETSFLNAQNHAALKGSHQLSLICESDALGFMKVFP